MIHALCDVDRLNAALFSNGFFDFVDFFVVNDFLSGSSKLARWGWSRFPLGSPLFCFFRLFFEVFLLGARTASIKLAKKDPLEVKSGLWPFVELLLSITARIGWD